MSDVLPTYPRIIFMGTGPFALPALDRLTKAYPVVGVVTQPDRQAGRGRKLNRGAIAKYAYEAGIKVLQPHTLKDESAASDLAKLEPDLLIVASYGLILPKSILQLPGHGALNLHPSWLPRHRGPSPVAGAILDGNRTGVTVMEMVMKMDAGPIVAQAESRIEAHENTEMLTARLARENADLLMESLPDWISGQITAVGQDEDAASYTSMLTKEMGRINWTDAADLIDRKVRAYNPWPVAFTESAVGSLRIYRAFSARSDNAECPGSVIGASDSGVMVETGDGLLIIEEIQGQGGRRMSAADFARGKPKLIGSVLGVA